MMQNSKPVWIYVAEPEDPEETRKLLKSQLTLGPLYTRSDRYLPCREHIDNVLAQGLSKDALAVYRESRHHRGRGGKAGEEDEGAPQVRLGVVRRNSR